MFHTIPTVIANQMERLEAIDSRDRADGTLRQQRLRQVPPETGRFLAIMAASAPPGDWLEAGTSAGYSALWLTLASAAVGRTLTTCEIDPSKVALARETFRLAGVEHLVHLVEGDVLGYLAGCGRLAFCFLDAEKEVYLPIYRAVVPKLVSGGVLLADNAINHQAALQPMLDEALADPRVDALVLPVGKGVLLCRKL